MVIDQLTEAFQPNNRSEHTIGCFLFDLISAIVDAKKTEDSREMFVHDHEIFSFVYP